MNKKNNNNGNCWSVTQVGFQRRKNSGKCEIVFQPEGQDVRARSRNHNNPKVKKRERRRKRRIRIEI
jgi:hypothetical protein